MEFPTSLKPEFSLNFREFSFSLATRMNKPEAISWRIVFHVWLFESLWKAIYSIVWNCCCFLLPFPSLTPSPIYKFYTFFTLFKENNSQLLLLCLNCFSVFLVSLLAFCVNVLAVQFNISRNNCIIYTFSCSPSALQPEREKKPKAPQNCCI